MTRDDSGVRLELASPDSVVLYQMEGRTVTRTEREGDQPSRSYDWSFDRTQVYFSTETAGSASRLVWITFINQAPVEWGSIQHASWPPP